MFGVCEGYRDMCLQEVDGEQSVLTGQRRSPTLSNQVACERNKQKKQGDGLMLLVRAV